MDLINNGHRGFSVETSKLEAVYFQPGFWGDLCQCTLGWAWRASAQLLTEKGPQVVFCSFSHPPAEDRSWSGGSLPMGREGYTGATRCTWLTGADGRENLSVPKRLGLPVGTALLAFPAHPLPLLLSLLKNPINTHFKWNLKLLLCERTL